MTRIVGTTCGWETGDVAEMAGTTSTSSGTLSAATSTPTPASGSYCCKAALTGAGGTQYCVRSLAFGANETDFWLRFRFYNSLTGADLSLVNSHRIIRFLDSAGTMIGSLALDASTGTFRYYRGGTATLGSSSGISGGTLVGSASSAIGTGAWNLIEVHLIPTTGATGTVEIWIDGTRVLNATSVQTSAGLANVASITYGVERNSASGGSASSYVAFDDFAANDTAGTVNNGRCGDSRVLWLPANGAGASSQWTPFSGANYTNVDDTGDLSAGTADYVSTNTTAQVDDYTCADLPSGASSVAVVIPMVYAANPDAGVTQLKVGIISGATTSAGTAQTPAATYTYLRGTQYETDPNTSAAWTATNVNAAKVRIESV